MSFTKHRNLFFAITGTIVAASIAFIAFFGLPLSIEFTGGSLVEVAYPEGRPSLEDARARLAATGLPGSVRESGENAFTIRTTTLSPDEHDALVLALADGAVIEELRFTSIGPALGEELATKALYAIVGVIIAIVLYIAWAFRKVSRPISSWVYGGTVILVLIHDIVVPAGFYALLAYFTGAQVDTLFVVGLLAILGYSVNDTIVIFDRVREHLKRQHDELLANPKAIIPSFEHTVDISIKETFTRSINTSVTTALALLAIVIVGSPETFHFALLLLAGVIAGTYSSILIAAPLLVPLAKKFAAKETSS